MNESIERDKEIAKNAITVYLQHFLISKRTEILQDLIEELNEAEIINIDWL